MRGPSCFVGLALTVCGIAASAVAEGLQPVKWSQLEFSASKFFLKATTAVEVTRLSAAEGRLALREVDDGIAGSGAVVKVVLTTDLPLGRSECASVWIDGSTGAVLQREKKVGGRHRYWKLHRYLAGGYATWRAAPADSKEEDLEVGAWSKRDEKRVVLDLSNAPSAQLTDSYALLYLVSAAGLGETGKELDLLIANDDELIRLHFTSGDLTERRVNYDVTKGGSTSRRKGRINLRVVTVTGSALDDSASADDVDTGFMGMQGGLTILLDPTSGVPVEVSGHSKGIGQLTVHLERAVMEE